MFHFDVFTQDLPPQAVGKHAKRVVKLFGIRDVLRRRDNSQERFLLDVRPGEIVYITGACGVGKTRLLSALYEKAPADHRLRLEDIELEAGRSVVDCIAESPLCRNELADALIALNKVCISDVYSLLQEPCKLSEGYKYRYRFARLLASDKTFVFADEFTSSMDRITAQLTAHYVRKLAARSGKIFFLASCHEDILRDLRPDVLVVRYSSGRHQVMCEGHVGAAASIQTFGTPPLAPAV